MSFLFRRVSHLRSFPSVSSKNGTGLRGSVNSRRFLSSTSKNSEGKVYNERLVSPLYTQTPPAWVRYAWAIIIANALIMGSAIEITWNHWATLVKDLEEIGEKNRAAAAVAESSAGVPQEAKNQETHWERRPIWQRATFCGIYGAGWALSSVYLLKYRQTFATSIRFFRAKPTSLAQSPSSASTHVKTSFQRFIHISTASNPSGATLALKELTVQDGRNETELVIRYANPAPTPGGGKPGRRKRDYWYVSLTGARVQGAKMGDVVSARDNVIWGWDGGIGNGGPILTPDGVTEEKNTQEKNTRARARGERKGKK